MKPRRPQQRRASNIHWPFSLPPSDLLPVPPIDWTQQNPIDAVHTGRPPGCRSEWRKVEMDLEGQMEKNAAWPLCGCRERHKNIFVPQCFLHNFSITNLHLLMGKCIYYILLLESSLGKLSSILSKTWILSTGTMFYFWAIERSQGLMFSSLYAGVLRGPISDTPVSYRTDIGIGQMKNFFKSHLEY